MVSKEFKFGLIGFPLDHSLSPGIHSAALRIMNLSGDYALFPVEPLPAGASDLAHLLKLLRKGELDGLNVTIPHKQTVLPQLDRLTPTSAAIGAVNTIYNLDGQLWGDNTDAAGFMADLDHLGWSHPSAEYPRAVILGAGGSARAVAYALSQAGWRLTIAARRLAQAITLAEDIEGDAGEGKDRIRSIRLDRSEITGLKPAPNLIVNTTPLGMTRHREESAWPAEVPFPPKTCIYDLVYNPPETKLLKTAREAGLQTANGLGMLVEQAALSFEIWTGARAPREVIRRSVTKENVNPS